MSDHRTLILGSSSPWRRDILRRAGYTIETMPAEIDEKAIRHPRPDQLVEDIALAKANALTQRLEGQQALLITADQVAVFEGVVLEKPDNADQARRFLRGYRSGTLSFCTAIVVTDVETCEWCADVDVCIAEIGPLSDAAIEEAIARGEVLNSCGAFVLADPAITPYVRLTSGSVSSCEGMPLDLLKRLLGHHNYMTN